jgi:putative GTP-binding protein
MNGAASGHYLENYVVSEILKNTSYGEKTVSLNFYRDTNQKEIDLVLEIEGGLYTFEIKRTASPERKLIRTFSLLEKSGKELKAGGIICMAEKPFPMDSSNFLLPVNLL